MKWLKRGRLPVLLFAGCAFALLAVLIRLVSTGQLDQWRVRRMPDGELSAVAARPNASYQEVLEWGKRQEGAGRFADAVKTFQRAAELRSTSPEGWVGWGRAAYNAGDWQSATIVLRKTLSLWPKDPDAHFAYAALLGSSFRLKAARDHLKQGLALEPRRPQVWQALGDLEMTLENPAGAVDAYQRALKQEPKSQPLQSRLGAALVKAGRWQEARTVLDASLKEDPSDLTARFHLAEALVNTRDEKDHVQGLAELSRVASFSTDKSDIWMLFARVWIKEDNTADAIQALERAYDSNRSNLEALELLVAQYRKQKRLPEARRFEPEIKHLKELVARKRELEEAIESERNLPRDLLLLGRVATELRDPRRANQALVAAGRLGADKKELSEAMAALQRPVLAR